MGSRLATKMSQPGNEVIIIDEDPKSFQLLPPEFSGRTYVGNGLQQDILLHADIEKANVFAAVTDSDVINAVLAYTAKEKFKIDRVVARCYDSKNASIYDEMGIQYLSALAWATQRMEELLEDDDFSTVFSAGNGEVEVYQLMVPQVLDGAPVSSLGDLQEAMIISITRVGAAYFPSPDFKLKKDDLLHISATFNGIRSLQAKLQQEEVQ